MPACSVSSPSPTTLPYQPVNASNATNVNVSYLGFVLSLFALAHAYQLGVTGWEGSLPGSESREF